METHPGLDSPTTEECASAPESVMASQQAQRLAAIFKALSDPTRVRLLAHISASADGTACACHLPGALGISQPTLSHHLRKLADAGVINREQRGRWAHYTAVPEVLDLARNFLGASVLRTTSCC